MSKTADTIAKCALIVSALSLLISGLSYWDTSVEHLNLIVNPSISAKIVDKGAKFSTTIEAFNTSNRTIIISKEGLEVIKGSLGSRPECRDASILQQLLNQLRNPSSISQQNKYFDTSDVSSEAGKTNTTAFALSSNQAAIRTISFDISSIEWAGGSEVVTLCPIFFVMEPSGKSDVSMCRGWPVTMVRFNNQMTFPFLESPRSLTLLPDTDASQCVRVDG